MISMYWQPIETAPKNGVPIFITNPKWAGAIKAHWGEYPGGHVEDSEGNAVKMWGWVFDDFTRILGAFWEENGFLGCQSDIDDGYMPTHWCYPPTYTATTEEPSVTQKTPLDAQQIIKAAVKVMEQAFYEFNAIKARDGAPQHIDWYRGQPLQTDSCTHEWWAEVTESLKTNLQALKGLIDD